MTAAAAQSQPTLTPTHSPFTHSLFRFTPHHTSSHFLTHIHPQLQACEAVLRDALTPDVIDGIRQLYHKEPTFELVQLHCALAAVRLEESKVNRCSVNGVCACVCVCLVMGWGGKVALLKRLAQGRLVGMSNGPALRELVCLMRCNLVAGFCAGDCLLFNAAVRTERTPLVSSLAGTLATHLLHPHLHASHTLPFPPTPPFTQ